MPTWLLVAIVVVLTVVVMVITGHGHI
jgi:hypothetical protein